MLTDHPEIDFLSFTSYSANQPDRLAGHMIDHRVSRESTLQEAVIQGYKGLSARGKPGGNIFCGKGENNAGQPGGIKYAHYYMKWSSDYSHRLLEYYDESVKCTRVDLQVTLPARRGKTESIEYLINRMYTLGHRAYASRGKPAKVSVVQSDTKTLYIGKRDKGAGGRLVRIYEKPSEDGNMYVRFELELRGNEAEAFVALLAEHRVEEATAGVLAEHMARFSHEYQDFLAPYVDVCRSHDRLECKVVREKERDTMSWLESMTDSWRKVLTDSETRSRAISLISRIQTMAIKCSPELDRLPDIV